MSMGMTMQELIAKVGRGERSAKDLTYQEASSAMRLLLENAATPCQSGAFLLAMRMKVESVAELAAFTSAARAYVDPLAVPAGLDIVDIPTYAGKRDGWHVLLPASIVAAAAGCRVLV